MTRKPIIAITLDYHIDEPGFQYASYPWYALRCDYSNIVTSLGGIPFFISYEKNLIADVLSIVDGVMITGGDFDVPPSLYNQTIKSQKVREGRLRSEYEYELVHATLKEDKPFLGICNGLQILNVALGGSLIQDVEEFVPNSISHKQPSPKHVPYHPMSIKSGTKLFDIAEKQAEWMVNSTHHQALDKVGSGLIVSAVAPDGIIEAVESNDHKFVIGVEWHPEYGSTTLDRNLIAAFLAKCNS